MTFSPEWWKDSLVTPDQTRLRKPVGVAEGRRLTFDLKGAATSDTCAVGPLTASRPRSGRNKAAMKVSEGE